MCLNLWDMSGVFRIVCGGVCILVMVNSLMWIEGVVCELGGDIIIGIGLFEMIEIVVLDMGVYFGEDIGVCEEFVENFGD